MNYQEFLEPFEREIQQLMESAGMQATECYIRPFCEKWNFRYNQGNGSFALYNKVSGDWAEDILDSIRNPEFAYATIPQNILNSEKTQNEFIKDCETLLNLLYYKILGNCIYFYTQDV